MKPILAATAALLFMSGAALAQTTSVQSAPPASDTGSNAYQAQGTVSPSTPTPEPTHHRKAHKTTKHHHYTTHHTQHHTTPPVTGDGTGSTAPQ